MISHPVAVRILHGVPATRSAPLERWVADARMLLAERHRRAFLDAGASDVSIVSGPPDAKPYGARLRSLARDAGSGGLVVLGSGAMPLASGRDYRELVDAASGDGRTALTNSRYSADVVAVACADALVAAPDLASDNALPRWLEEAAGYDVRDLRTRWRLAFDVDGPLDLVLLGAPAPGGAADVVRGRMAAVRDVAADRRAELVVAGRTSAATIAWLERAIPARVRAIVEERGLRAAGVVSTPGSRHPASLLGTVLDHDGPGALGSALAPLGEAAIVDSRVLLAHRLGPDEAAWPPPEDRFASDLLLHERVRDPWLRELTRSAASAPIPVLLGGHSLVGPGVRLLFGRGFGRPVSWT